MLLQRTQTTEIKLESLSDGPGLLPYKLGPTKLTTHYHTFLQYVRLDDIEDNIHSLQNQLLTFQNQLTNDTYLLYEIQIDYLSNKLGKMLSHLRTLEPNRAKRGLIDSLGSVIKSITGNLDYTDALRYNEAIKTLKDNQLSVASEFDQHLSLSKEWMSKHSNAIIEIAENQRKINETLILILNSNAYRQTSLIKYAKFAQLLEIISDNVEDLMLELIRIENTLAFIRASSTHHSMIDIDVLGSMLSKLRNIYSSDQILNLELRDYYDVIKPGSYYTEKQIVFIFKFPITSRDNFDLYRLSIVPNKNSQALIPTYPFIATNELSFVYIETECPKFNHWYLCEERTTYQIRTQPDCIQELITKQVIQEACNLTTIILSKEAMEKLDDQHYILSFPHYTKVQLSCGRKEFTMLQGSYLITIPASCLLKTAEFTIVNDNNEIKGQPLKLTGLPFRSPEQATASTRIHLNSIHLQGLHSIQDKILMQSPVQLRAISDTLYHTTIPFYIILSSGGILIFVLATRRYISRCRKETSKAAQSPTPNSEDHGNSEIPATFSLNILK